MLRLLTVALCVSLLSPVFSLAAEEGLLHPRKTEAQTQQGGDDNSIGQLAWQVFLFLSIVGGGTLLIRYQQRKRQGLAGVSTGQLQLLETKALGSRQFLVVAQCSGRKLLLGVGPGYMRHLCFLDEQQPKSFPEIDTEEEDEGQVGDMTFRWFPKRRAEGGG